MKKILFGLGAICLLAVASCKKDDDNKSRTETLTSGKWQITGSKTTTTVNNTSTVDDDYASWDACEKDNFITFNTNNTYTADEGATKCNSNDPQTDIGNWAFVNSEKSLLIDGTSLNIDEFNNSTLRLSSSDTSTFSGATYIYKSELTLSHR